MLFQRAEGGHIQDLVVETAQRASVTDAHDGGPPGAGAQQAVEPGLGVFIQSRGGLVQKQECRLKSRIRAKASRCCSPSERR